MTTPTRTLPVVSSRPATSNGLSRDELHRYSRHLLIPEVGAAGQRRLKDASVLVVGVGGLGSPAALYLAAAGVGRIGLVDDDTIDASNLQRQVLYATQEVGASKLERAKERLVALNPNVQVDLHPVRLTSHNALDLVARYDVVLDGTDNFPTRYLVNDACVLTGRPNVYGSIYRFEGQVSVFSAAEGPCYRCLYPNPPPPGLVPSCAEGGVLGVLPGVVGSMQANEAIKVLLGIGRPLIGRLLLYDAFEMEFVEVKLRKDPACAVCGPAPSVTRLIDYEAFCGMGRGAAAPEAQDDGTTITATHVKQRLDAADDLVLLDVREPMEVEIGQIPGSLHIPMAQVPGRLAELPRDREIVCYCRTGARSAQVARWLRTQGLTRVRNLTGGIHAWADEVDPQFPKY